MKLKETARQVWRSLEMLAHAVEYDEQADLKRRVERLERLTAHLKMPLEIRSDLPSAESIGVMSAMGRKPT